MPSRAIVIGIDRYWTPAACLKGAVGDALRMAGWLLQDAGLAPGQLTLLLSPAAGSTPAAPAPFQEADQANILAAVRDAARQPAGPADRLYFYYAGHGITAPSDFEQAAIVPSDFTDFLTIRAIGLQSLFQCFQASGFTEQFFFIDACRNIPFADRFRVSDFPFPPDSRTLRPDVEQFIFLATSRGLTAAEIRDLPGQEYGVFTGALLDGLRGKGAAKRYRVADNVYQVTVESLRDYVVRQVRDRVRKLPNAAAQKYFQTPVLTGEHFGNPVLAELPAAQVGPVTLEVAIQPAEAAPEASVRIRRDGPPVAVLGPPVAAERIELAPRDYRIEASAASFVPQRPYYAIDLYEDAAQVVVLSASQPAPAPPPQAASAAATRGFIVPTVAASEPAMSGGPTRLHLQAGDELALLEILDADQNVIAAGHGRLEAVGLAPGPYRARLRTPRGETVEQPVVLDPGEEEVVHLRGPAPPETGRLAELLRDTFTVLPDNTVAVSESLGVGNLVSPSLASILTLAAVAENHDPGELGAYRLRSMGLDALRASVPASATSALHLLLGDEFEAETGAGGSYLASIAVQAWSMDDPLPASAAFPTVAAAAGDIAEFAAPCPARPLWLNIAPPGQPPVVFALSPLAGRLATLIFHRNPRQRISVFQYLPPLFPAATSDRLGPRLQRRLEIIQRLYQNHRFEEALALCRPKQIETPEEQALADWQDPIGACLAGYLLLRLAAPSQLDEAAGNIAARFDGLCDALVIAAHAALNRGDRLTARALVAAALDRGLPLFAEGLELLDAAVQACGLDHPAVARLRRVLRRRIAGLIWTAWTPERLSAGERVG